MHEKPETYAMKYYNQYAPPDFVIEEKVICPKCLLGIKYEIDHPMLSVSG